MPGFKYWAYRNDGSVVVGDLDVATIEVAESTLWDRGIAPFRILAKDRADEPWWRREVFSFSKGRSLQLGSFTRDLAELSASGISIDDCLRIIADQATSPDLRRIAHGLLDRVLGGASLADALADSPTVFSLEYRSVVSAGELGGTLGQALSDLADLMERREAVAARIRAALTYPAILVVFAVISMGVIVGVLLPGIEPIFVQNAKSPPRALQILITIRDQGWMLGLAAAGFVGGAVAVVLAVRKSPERRLAADAVKLKIPVLSGILLNSETARFTRTLGTLLKSGVPLLQALTSAHGVVKNRLLAGRIADSIGLVREGQSLSRALGGQAAVPPIALRMIAIGEEAARLDAMLLRTARIFEETTQRAVDRLMVFLTPALTVSIAVLVGGLILSVMSALLSINDLATG